MRFRMLTLLLPVLVSALAGCAEQAPTTAPPAAAGPVTAAIDDPCGEVTVVTLYAGQTIDVGTVTVANDGDSLCVTYATTGGWLITETHLHIGLTLADIPQTNSGNPKVGKFAYSHTLSPPADVDEYCFDLGELGYTAGTLLYIAAHAKVTLFVDGVPVQTETAWGDGADFPGANWATYLMHTVQECNEEGPFEEGAYQTHTQAEWGGLCAGAGAACYLETNFDACVDDLVLGCTAGWTVRLTSAGAVSDLLPTDGSPASLAESYVDPALDAAGGEDPLAQATEAGELLGQTVALALNVYFDGCDPGFGGSETPLADVVVCDPFSPLAGWTVGEVLAEANATLGGCGSGAILPEQLNAALKAINENFVPGSSVGSYLCPAEPGGGGGGE